MNAAAIDTDTSLEQAVNEALTLPCETSTGECQLPGRWLWKPPCCTERLICDAHRHAWLNDGHVWFQCECGHRAMKDQCRWVPVR